MRDKERMSGRYEEEESTHSRSRQARQRARKKKKKKMIVLVIIEVLALLVIAAGAFAYFYVQNQYDKIETVAFQKHDVATNPDLPSSVVETSKGYRTIMFYGVDARNNSDLTKNANSDSVIICSINNDTKEIKLVSILRDTMVQTTDGKYHKLTDVYAAYGVQEALETINRNFDLNITEYVTVNWYAVAETIDLMGGLDIEITDKEAAAINQFLWETSKSTGIASSNVDVYEGVHHLDGIQSTTYARVRNVGHHDITRAERQRKVISLMLEKAKQSSIGTLNDICNTVFPNISTNLTLSDILSLASDVASYKIADQGLFPYKYWDQSGGHYYVYCNTLTENVDQLHTFLFGNEEYTPSSTVQTISEYILDYRSEHQ